MSSESHSWIVVVVGPISSVLIASIFLYGALFSRFRLAFGLISLGGVFFFVSYAFWLAAALQLLSRESFRFLFPVQALSLYLGIAVAVIGDSILVWQVTRSHDVSKT